MFNYDYSKVMLMKLGIGTPDNHGGCRIFNTFEEALEKIKIVDHLTLGAPKIIYLVGWQYQGHDDRYPAFFEVNKSAKRLQDKTALESLLWLVEEAKKYHTVISYHINLSDAYPNSPLWDTYLKNDLILKNAFGKLKKTGSWNGRTAYQVRFKQEYLSGFFKKRIDKLFELLPIEEAGTIHIDAFFVRKGKNTTIPEEKIYRRKMIEYFASRGVDVTSEFIYREKNNGLRLHFGKSDILGYIPAIWNLVLTQKEYENYHPHIVAGGQLNMDLQLDQDLQYLFYGNTRGEDIFKLKDNFAESFTKKFALGSVPYLFLNAHKLQKIQGIGKNRVAYFQNGVQSEIKNKRILQNGVTLKENETLCLPVAWKKNSYYAYSNQKGMKNFSIPCTKAVLKQITPEGQKFLMEISGHNESISVPFDGKSSYEIQIQR